jgi:hypothetical protein
MRAEFITAYPSAQIRAENPEPDNFHPRAKEMADLVKELTGGEGGASESQLLANGFTMEEIIEHMPDVQRILRRSFVRQLNPPGDRVPEIIMKALASANHEMPKISGIDPSIEAIYAWGRYCAARAAWMLDPWISQQERCIHLLDAFLRKIGPLLPREVNRITYAIAASMKAEARKQ